MTQGALRRWHSMAWPAAALVLATTSRDSVDFYSRNSNQISLRPQLAITLG